MTSYWPWWAGAIALAIVTINYTLTTDRAIGVSGTWDRVVNWRRERAAERLDAGVDRRALEAALRAGPIPAPRHAVGAGSPGGVPGGDVPGDTLTDGATTGGDAPDDPSQAPLRRPLSLASQAALLISITLGGLLAAVTGGRFDVRLDMGDAFGALVTANPFAMVGVLFVGGVLVGFGTRLAGGCSSGHGLSGCGRGYPVSMLATAAFFGTAVAVSFLLEMI